MTDNDGNPHPHEKCHDCHQFFKCDDLPPCAIVQVKPRFSSEDLLLLANDEWKRRMERKHQHDSASWISGFINGFCTDKKWAREYVDKIREKAVTV